MIPATVSRRSSFLGRMLGAALLRPAIYEEVEADRDAVPAALAVVMLSAAAAGVGSVGFRQELPAFPIYLIALSTLTALLAWGAWALVTTQIGTRLLPDPRTHADVGELLRTTGFAAAPGVLRVFGIVPALATPVLVVSTVWMLAAMVVAVRQALDYTSTARAIAVCVLGWTFAMGLAVLFGVMFGPRLG